MSHGYIFFKEECHMYRDMDIIIHMKKSNMSRTR